MAFRRANQPRKSITQHDCVVLLDETLKTQNLQSSSFGKAQIKIPHMVSKLLVTERRSLAIGFTRNDNINAFYTIVNGKEINKAGERSSVLKLIPYHDTRISLLGFTLRDQISIKHEQTYSEDIYKNEKRICSAACAIIKTKNKYLQKRVY